MIRNIQNAMTDTMDVAKFSQRIARECVSPQDAMRAASIADEIAVLAVNMNERLYALKVMQNNFAARTKIQKITLRTLEV